jgi:hypothetical protein
VRSTGTSSGCHLHDLLLEPLHGQAFADHLVQAVAAIAQVVELAAVVGHLGFQLGDLVGQCLQLLRPLEHDLADGADQLAAAVADRVARDDARDAAHFMQQADLRLAALDHLVQPRVLDHFCCVAAHAAAGPQAEEALVDRAHVAHDRVAIDHRQRLEGIGQEVGEDVAREIDRADEFEQGVTTFALHGDQHGRIGSGKDDHDDRLFIRPVHGEQAALTPARVLPAVSMRAPTPAAARCRWLPAVCRRARAPERRAGRSGTRLPRFCLVSPLRS